MGKFKKKSIPLPKTKSRKEIRKEKRLNKKRRRNERFSKSPEISLRNKPAIKKLNDSEECSFTKQLKQRQKDEKMFKKLEHQMRNERKRQLLEANEEEDKVIKDLEKKLKLNRRKNRSVPKSFVSEGLDYLLEVCSYERFTDSTSLEKELQEADDEFEDDLALITGSVKRDDQRNMLDEPISDDGTSRKGEVGDTDDDWFSDECDDLTIAEDEKNSIDFDDEIENEYEENPKIRKVEDIYGRLRDDKGNVAEETAVKYVPPHLRTQSTIENNENLLRLAKQMKGCLNRLTEKNMHSTATEIENLYMKHSRHDINSTLLKLLFDSLISSVLSPERIIIDHALLISILHANIGSEIGANILQHMVNEFDKLFRENHSVEDKRIDNLVLFLCQLYLFKVFHACLLYDILNKFVAKFEEKDIELVLIILRNVGFNLRKDDSFALKEFILKVQQRANESSHLRENVRVKFMLDTLTAVKNNNMLKVQNYDPTYVDHLKKIQKALLRPGKYVTELKISLGDLLNADTRGRWWIIGSAWSGNIANKDEDKAKTSCDQLVSFDQKILALAKKQRMNTETRVNIFCILMTAETYTDACEKLLRLGLKGKQYQEILHVLMHCLLKEKKYNPYYSFIAEHFCDVDRKYQLAVQYSVWDKFKEIESLKTKQITNLARFLSYLLLEKKLPLSVLKILQFTEMKKQMVRLLRQIMLAVLLSDDESVIVDIFTKISKSEKLLTLREGLQFFFRHFMLKNANVVALENEKFSLLPKRIELAENILQSSSSY